jgi:hypothetical protein
MATRSGKQTGVGSIPFLVPLCYRRSVTDRVRLDPLDPKTSRHAGQCEFASETDAAVLKLALKVKDGMGGDGLLVGGVQRLRHCLAGSALRRERRVTRNPLPSLVARGRVESGTSNGSRGTFPSNFLGVVRPHLHRRAKNE